MELGEKKCYNDIHFAKVQKGLNDLHFEQDGVLIRHTMGWKKS